MHLHLALHRPPAALHAAPRLLLILLLRARCSKPDGAFFANSVSRSPWMDGWMDHCKRMVKKVAPGLHELELSPMARGSQGAGSRNLAPALIFLPSLYCTDGYCSLTHSHSEPKRQVSNHRDASDTVAYILHLRPSPRANEPSGNAGACRCQQQD